MASPPPARRAWEFVRAHLFTAGLVAVALAVVLGTVSVSFPTAGAAPASAVTPVDEPSGDPAADASAAPGTPAAEAPPVKPRKPRPASATHKARNVPAYPRDKHHGKRIVYDKALMTVWLVDKNDQVVARFPVVGRFDRPVAGVYHVFSKSEHSSNPFSKVTFEHMVRFAYGPDTKSAIGLHSIPRYYDGTRMHSVKQLGLAIARGGCVRLSDRAAAIVYAFARVGTRVVVLPSP